MRDGEKSNRLVRHTYQNYARKLNDVYTKGFRGFDKLSIPDYPDGANRRTVDEWIESDPEALFKFIKHSGRGSVRIDRQSFKKLQSKLLKEGKLYKEEGQKTYRLISLRDRDRKWQSIGKVVGVRKK